MSAVDEILSRVPIQQLAAQLGTDEQTARSAAQSAATQLLGGLAGNAQDPQGEVSLASALNDHARSNHLLDADTVDLGAVDEQDADKILGHVFADPQVAALSGAQQAAGGVSQDMMMKVLKLLAPIVLAYLAKNLQGGKYGDILGQVIGGGQASRSGAGGGGILGQILGQVLGGGAAGGLGGALGGGADSSRAERPVDTTPTTPSGGFQPSGGGAGGGLRMDDGVGDDDVAGSSSQAPSRQAPQSSGGVFGDILGKIFGR